MACSKQMRQLRLVVIGKTGSGKSKSANTILGMNLFKSGADGSSITDTCQYGAANVFGYEICIVDTPGLFDTRKKVDMMKEIQKCIFLSAPGPHAILLTVQIGRFTEEDVKTVNTFASYFGEKLKDYVYILFTRYDDWKRDNDGKEDKFEKYIESLPDFAKQFVATKCKNKYMPFDNTMDDLMPQVNLLLQAIDHMVLENGSTFYTNADFQLAAQIMKERLEEEMKKNNSPHTPSMWAMICDAVVAIGMVAGGVKSLSDQLKCIKGMIRTLRGPEPLPIPPLGQPGNNSLLLHDILYFQKVFSQMGKN